LEEKQYIVVTQIMLRRFTILLLTPHLGGGGAESVIAQLACSLPRDIYDVHLGVVTRSSIAPKTMPPGVHVHTVGAQRVLFGAFGLVRMVWRIHPDLILSGMFHLNFLVILLRPLFPRMTHILIRQNGMLPKTTTTHRSRVQLQLYRATYPRADGIICQSAAMEAEITGFLGLGTKTHVLRNPVDGGGIRRTVERSTSHWSGRGPNLLAIGRLSFEKGIDLLLDAFALVRNQYPSANLTILGEGDEENVLRAQCNRLGLGTCVRFAGYVAEPASWFPGASLMVIPSRADAFPNVLLEAAAAGLPIVATPCSIGVTELLESHPGAWLAAEVSSGALAQSLTHALATLATGQRFRHSWLAPYELHHAVGKYEALIRQTLTGPVR
jgi:glycosyltransferase involved in cell wall biosynthesis